MTVLMIHHPEAMTTAALLHLDDTSRMSTAPVHALKGRECSCCCRLDTQRTILSYISQQVTRCGLELLDSMGCCILEPAATWADTAAATAHGVEARPGHSGPTSRTPA
jgi:hypothetical protein